MTLMHSPILPIAGRCYLQALKQQIALRIDDKAQNRTIKKIKHKKDVWVNKNNFSIKQKGSSKAGL